MNLLKITRQSMTAFALSLLMLAPAYALDLGDAKSKGLVGETHSGYLAAVKSSSEVSALVKKVNAKRKTYYQNIADKNGISLEAVEARAGQKAISKTAKGNYINTGSGWEKK